MSSLERWNKAKMGKKKSFFKSFTIMVFIFCALGIGVLVIFPAQNNAGTSQVEQQARVVVPRIPDFRTSETDDFSELFYIVEDDLTSKVPLADGEIVLSVLTDFFDEGPVEKQFVAYRNLAEAEGPVYLTFIDYDLIFRSYTRVWNGVTAATQAGTIRIISQDLLGDRSVCVLLFGMNGQGENTLTIYRRNNTRTGEPFTKIFELSIDGTITVREVPRSFAYQTGQSTWESFTISAFGRDYESANILDQVEIVFAFNPSAGVYQESNRSRIPGSQVEQRLVRELLGNPRLFEGFVAGLWHFVNPQGIIDGNQYIYFDPSGREVVFYSDGIQQIFTWRSFTPTRYGLHIFGQNISIANLRRSIDIELESLDSIRIRVREDIRLRVSVGNPWDGSYRKIGPPNQTASPQERNSHVDLTYEGHIGRISFYPDGSFELNTGALTRQGIYAFFNINEEELLELRYDDSSELAREIFLVESDEELMVLSHVRIGSRGVTRLHERPVTLTLVE